MRTLLIFSVSVALVAGLASRLSAAGPAEAVTPADTALSGPEIERRIAFIEQRLEERQRATQIWYWSWMAFNGGSMVGLGIVAGLSKHGDDKVSNGVQAGLGAIGVADLLLRQPEARYGTAPIAGLPEDTREEKIIELRAAESRLHSNAEQSEQRRSWVVHLGDAAVNGLAGLAIALAGRTSDGIIAFASGVAFGELQIWTQPSGPIIDWQDYKRQVGGEAHRPELGVYVVTLPFGGAEAGLRWQW
jgi:hypothetical protein